MSVLSRIKEKHQAKKIDKLVTGLNADCGYYCEQLKKGLEPSTLKKDAQINGAQIKKAIKVGNEIHDGIRKSFDLAEEGQLSDYSRQVIARNDEDERSLTAVSDRIDSVFERHFPSDGDKSSEEILGIMGQSIDDDHEMTDEEAEQALAEIMKKTSLM